jgi:hypothetical protein
MTSGTVAKVARLAEAFQRTVAAEPDAAAVLSSCSSTPAGVRLDRPDCERS